MEQGLSYVGNVMEVSTSLKNYHPCSDFVVNQFFINIVGLLSTKLSEFSLPKI